MKTKPTATAKPPRRIHQLPAHFVFLLLASATSTLTAQSTNLVSVAAAIKTEHADPKGSIDEVVKKNLEIELRGSAKLQGEVKVTCTFFADDLTAGKIVALKSNSLTAGLEAGKSTRIASPAVTFSFTPQHSEKSGSGKRTRYKRIEATGNRYHGWSIQVFKGDELVGEAFSIPSIKKLLEK